MCKQIKFLHVHCKTCGSAISQRSVNPCVLCVWRGRDLEKKPKQGTLFE